MYILRTVRQEYPKAFDFLPVWLDIKIKNELEGFTVRDLKFSEPYEEWLALWKSLLESESSKVALARAIAAATEAGSSCAEMNFALLWIDQQNLFPSIEQPAASHRVFLIRCHSC